MGIGVASVPLIEGPKAGEVFGAMVGGFDPDSFCWSWLPWRVEGWPRMGVVKESCVGVDRGGRYAFNGSLNMTL